MEIKPAPINASLVFPPVKEIPIGNNRNIVNGTTAKITETKLIFDRNIS